MEKYLVNIEFRYSDRPKGEHDCSSKSKEITIGIYDDFNEACINGNKILKLLESKYKLNPNWNKKERFSKNGGISGTKNILVSNLGYLQTPFTFFARIETLKYDDIEESITDVLKAIERYKDYKIRSSMEF